MHKTVKIYLFDIYKGYRCCGVHGYHLDFIHETCALLCCGCTQSIFTLHWSICLFSAFLKSYHPALSLSGLSSKNWKEKPRMWWSHSSLQPVCHYFQHLLTNLFPVLPCFIWFDARKGHFILQMMSADGQASGRFLLPLLCLIELPGGFFARWSGAESSFRPWSLWTGSVALLAQVIDQIKESTVIPLSVAEGWLPLAESRREAGLRLCTVCLSVFPLSLLSFGGSCCFISVVQRPVLNCIKLYRLCKKLNVA